MPSLAFNELPPVDIWPGNAARFSEINFQRVSLDNYWLIRKPKYIRALTLSGGLILLSCMFIQASDNDAFLLIFTVVLIGIIAFTYQRDARNGDERDGDGSGFGCSTAGCGGTLILAITGTRGTGATAVGIRVVGAIVVVAAAVRVAHHRDAVVGINLFAYYPYMCYLGKPNL